MDPGKITGNPSVSQKTLTQQNVSKELNKLGTQLDKASTKQLQTLLSRFQNASQTLDNAIEVMQDTPDLAEDLTNVEKERNQMQANITFVEEKIATKLPDNMPKLKTTKGQYLKNTQTTQDLLKQTINEMKTNNEGMDKQIEENGIKQLIKEYLNNKQDEGKSILEELKKLQSDDKNSFGYKVSKLDDKTKELVKKLENEMRDEIKTAVDQLNEDISTNYETYNGIKKELKELQKKRAPMVKELINLGQKKYELEKTIQFKTSNNEDVSDLNEKVEQLNNEMEALDNDETFKNYQNKETELTESLKKYTNKKGLFDPVKIWTENKKGPKEKIKEKYGLTDKSIENLGFMLTKKSIEDYKN